MENPFDNLYARDSKGRINTWSIIVRDVGTHSAIRIYEGLIDGKNTETIRLVKSGKNIGKMNATTHYEQAISQAQSRWNKKKKEGYKSLIDLEIHSVQDLEVALPMSRTDNNGCIKPMKAQGYFKDNGDVRISFPCYAQPKLNGFRVMASWEEVEEGEGMFKEKVGKVVFRSKEGLRYTILEHIEQQFDKQMFLDNNLTHTLVYDGEMYIHGEILSEISSAVRKRNSKTSLLKFYIFDIATDKSPQKERLEALKRYIDYKEGSWGELTSIVRVLHNIINSNEEAQAFTDECIKEGYEGAIFRDMNALYRFGSRPITMTKLKRSQDKEFTIIDVVGGENSPELGVFVCLAENGKEFKVTPEGTVELKKEYLSNKSNYIGKKLTVKFFERTKDNIPFHSIGIDIRNYE